MESFLFSLNAVAPIIIMVAIGYLLKKLGIIPQGLVKGLNKIVFKILLPASLFLNIYKVEDVAVMNPGFILYAVVAILLLFALALPLTHLFTKERARKGPLIQSVFRSNFALIGIPLVESVCGSSGGAVASLLSAVSIPVFNILAVLSLSVYSTEGERVSVKKTLFDIVTNPLIVGVALALGCLGIRAGLTSADIAFRLSDIKPLYQTISYLASAATPLALLALGAQLEFGVIRNMKHEIIFGTVMKTVVTPLLALTASILFFDFEVAHYACFVALFTTPVAVSTVPMAQEAKADVDLAGQLVIWSTIASALSMFVAIYILKIVAIF
ncbi:MAG: AEC family transporter [Clostridia bacterium]|nr:AEC family transporter [Clostridia bacterium]